MQISKITKHLINNWTDEAQKAAIRCTCTSVLDVILNEDGCHSQLSKHNNDYLSPLYKYCAKVSCGNRWDNVVGEVLLFHLIPFWKRSIWSCVITTNTCNAAVLRQQTFQGNISVFAYLVATHHQHITEDAVIMAVRALRAINGPSLLWHSVLWMPCAGSFIRGHKHQPSQQSPLIKRHLNVIIYWCLLWSIVPAALVWLFIFQAK